MSESEPTGPRSAQLLIVTGMSGAGRSTVANVLEDRGWYVIDNLPPQMLMPMAELLEREGQAGARFAAVVDVRSRAFFADFRDGLDGLREHGWRPTVVFVDATDESLVRRFESVRRPHPLQEDGRMLDGIVREREMLRDLRANADLLIDTSGLNVHQLTAKVHELVGADERPPLRIAVMSFGFKYGIPLDADLVFDMRFLPNPFWNPELRPFSGLDQVVADFVLAQPGAADFIERVLALLEPMTAGYLREGRSYVTLAVGCTGGKHRSVAVAEELGRRIEVPQVGTLVVHRDLGRE
ncbi:RNase adapter RapZ [Luteipulveratus sp. YIM 133132]|uniref:RNase adapter RapZ n=1 Tax=Luteipulveratus flavus TaxID=3031728 RepID=A0ABT6C9T8_9MICO|nr:MULTISPECIES: RNase adapter RapZ [unclassified Luteipulveratus]MDE9364516.1 RNase adapter RapZ [Luteipulveratus sp. YIM 133132]MDF8264056.1 RNase adapter RapZ [Luteipulveratus sp. YIM 133296]